MIFAAPRCSEIPELLEIRDVFEKKYGKDFVSAATDLRPNAGVNRMVNMFSIFHPRICHIQQILNRAFKAVFDIECHP